MLVSCPSTRGHKSNEDLVLWYLDSHLFSFCTNNRDSQLVFYHWSREKRAFQIGRNDRGHKPLFYPIRHVCKTFWTHKSPAWPPFFILWKNAQWPHLLFLLVKRNQTCNVLTVFLRRKCKCLFSSVLCRHFLKVWIMSCSLCFSNSIVLQLCIQTQPSFCPCLNVHSYCWNIFECQLNAKATQGYGFENPAAVCVLTHYTFGSHCW